MKPRAEQKESRAGVGNRGNIFEERAYQAHKRVLIQSGFQSDPHLLAAILKRNAGDIKHIVDTTDQFHSNKQHETLSEDLFNILKHTHGDLLGKPVMLAMSLASSENTETTKNNEPTRLDVLHTLAENFDFLVESAHQKGHYVPNLAEILDYGRNFKTSTPLHTFILGLSEENKEKAAKILNAKMTDNPKTSDESEFRPVAAPAA